MTAADVVARTAMVANLHALADLLDAHPDLPRMPYVTTSSSGAVDASWYLAIFTSDLAEQKSQAAAIVRALGGKWNKAEVAHSDDFNFTQQRDGLELTVQVARPAVCERVVVGVETVTREIVDPNAPKVTVTEEIEKVEWRCQPLLDDAVEQAEAVPA